MVKVVTCVRRTVGAGWALLSGSRLFTAFQPGRRKAWTAPAKAAALCLFIVAQAAAADGVPQNGPPTPDDGASGGRTRYLTPEDPHGWIKPLDEIDVFPQPSDGPLPADCSANLFVPAGTPGAEATLAGRWQPTAFYWLPSEVAFQPLYFDDVPLERYGQSVCPVIQPVLSGVHFFGMFPIMPYKIGVDRTHDCISSLGYYRPGSAAPCVRQRLPWETDAALIESGAWVGLIFLLP